MQIFAAGDDINGNPKVYSIWTDAADPTPLWSNWTDYSGQGQDPLGNTTLALLPDTRTQIFYVDGANVVFTKWMTTVRDPNAPWSDWSGLGSLRISVQITLNEQSAYYYRYCMFTRHIK